MIIRDLQWITSFGGWGDTRTQVEFSDGADKKFILVSKLSEDWKINIGPADMMELLEDGENVEESAEVSIEGELMQILPEIVKSPYGLDICFAMTALDYFLDIECSEDEYFRYAEEYIKPYTGKDSRDLY